MQSVRRDGRGVEGARLESEYAVKRIVGSNPTLSANNKLGCNFAVLDGEVAVPCNLQSAIAGLNSI